MSNGLKVSRLEARLDAEILASRSSLEADCKRAERAAYHSRLGKFELARAELEVLRKKYEFRPNVQMSSWLNLVGGLIGHFSNMDRDARGKVLRAHALSAAANLPGIRALSAAWLAHLDYLEVNVVSMVQHVQEALSLSGAGEHSARSRVSLVLAQAYHLAGRLDLALPWYGNTRAHAVDEGDDATVSALMHNMAWLRAQRLRASDCGLIVEPDPIEEHAMLGAESSANFDQLIGSISLPALVPILRAQIHVVRAEYSQALSLFEAELSAAIQQGMGRLHADLLADQAWCRVQCGQVDAALRDALAAQANIDEAGQFDDRAVAYGRLAQTFDALGNSWEAATNRRLAGEAWDGHVLLQGRILKALGEASLNK